MIKYALAIGFGWIFLAAVATLTMLATVALNDGPGAISKAFWEELPTSIGLASPGIILVLIVTLSWALAGRRWRAGGENGRP